MAKPLNYFELMKLKQFLYDNSIIHQADVTLEGYEQKLDLFNKNALVHFLGSIRILEEKGALNENFLSNPPKINYFDLQDLRSLAISEYLCIPGRARFKGQDKPIDIEHFQILAWFLASITILNIKKAIKKEWLSDPESLVDYDTVDNLPIEDGSDILSIKDKK